MKLMDKSELQLHPQYRESPILRRTLSEAPLSSAYLQQNGTYHTERSQLGSSNCIYMVQGAQSYEIFIPAYIQMKVRNLKNVNLANRQFLFNVEIDLAISYGEMSHLMLVAIQKRLQLKIGDRILTINNGRGISLAIDTNDGFQNIQNEIKVISNEKSKTIKYTIVTDAYFIFSTNYPDDMKEYQSSVRFSPFQEIKCRLELQLEPQSFLGSEISEKEYKKQNPFDMAQHATFLTQLGINFEQFKHQLTTFDIKFNLMNFGKDGQILKAIRKSYGEILSNYDNLKNPNKAAYGFFHSLKNIITEKRMINRIQKNYIQENMLSFQSYKLENHYSVIRSSIYCEISNESFRDLCKTKQTDSKIIEAKNQSLVQKQLQFYQLMMERQQKANNKGNDNKQIETENQILYKILLKKIQKVYIIATEQNAYIAGKKNKSFTLEERQKKNCLWNVKFQIEQKGTIIVAKISNAEENSANDDNKIELKMVLIKSSERNMDYTFELYKQSKQMLQKNQQKTSINTISFIDSSGMQLKKLHEFYLNQLKQLNNKEDLTQLQNYEYINYHMTLYKKPGIPLLIQYVPVFMIAFINLSLFFSPLNLNERIAQTGIFLIAYMAYIPMFRKEVAHYDSILWAEILIYGQIFSSCLPIVDALIQNEGQQRLGLDDQYFTFWLSFGITMGIALVILIRFLYHRLYKHYQYRKKSYQLQENQLQQSLNLAKNEVYQGQDCEYHNLMPKNEINIYWSNNFQSDYLFYRNQRVRTLKNVISEGSLQMKRFGVLYTPQDFKQDKKGDEGADDSNQRH